MQGRHVGGLVGGKSEANQPPHPPGMHIVLKLPHRPGPGRDGLRFPGSRSEDDQRVEDVFIEPGCAHQCVMPVLDRRAQAAPQGRPAG